jgi:hypothetical protein
MRLTAKCCGAHPFYIIPVVLFSRSYNVFFHLFSWRFCEEPLHANKQTLMMVTLWSRSVNQHPDRYKKGTLIWLQKQGTYRFENMRNTRSGNGAQTGEMPDGGALSRVMAPPAAILEQDLIDNWLG